MSKDFHTDKLAAMVADAYGRMAIEQLRPNPLLDAYVKSLPKPTPEQIEARRLEQERENAELVARIRAMTDEELVAYIDHIHDDCDY